MMQKQYAKYLSITSNKSQKSVAEKNVLQNDKTTDTGKKSISFSNRARVYI